MTVTSPGNGPAPVTDLEPVYLSQVDRAEAPRGRAGVAAVPGTVVALGAVSFLTDVSSEMVTAFLPLYLVYTLQIGYLQFGFLDGLYTGATAVLRLVGGHVADRFRRPRTVAGVGYGLSALTRLGLLGVGASGAGIGTMVALDRAGKGLRTAPRDALIAAAVPIDRLGAAFGVHRTMDTAGALLGPVITFLLLVNLGTAPQPVFVVSFCFALLGLIVLAGFVRERPVTTTAGTATTAPVGPRPSVRATLALIADPRLRRASIVAAVLGLATLSDAFLFLLLQQTSGVSPGVLPLLPLGTAAVFLLAATPVGRLADRAGRRRVFVAGHLLLGVGYLLMLGTSGPGVVVAVLVLHGLFYACTDGVLAAWVAEFVPESLRASGLAAVQTAQALARFASSVLTGVLLTVAAEGVALWVATGALTVAVITGLAVMRNRATSRNESAGAGQSHEEGPA